MIKYLLLISLIATGAAVATATNGTPAGSNAVGSCKLHCNQAYQAGIANCSTLYGTGMSNVDFQNCAAQVLADYYACVSLCH